MWSGLHNISAVITLEANAHTLYNPQPCLDFSVCMTWQVQLLPNPQLSILNYVLKMPLTHLILVLVSPVIVSYKKFWWMFADISEALLVAHCCIDFISGYNCSAIYVF